MKHCEVLVVGGGPAGSTCAWKLRQAGVAVVVLDRSIFLRDKVCAGWITPPILQSLELDVKDYATGRVFQPFASFAAGMMGGPTIRTNYHRPVSYGILRSEFDDYLLRRSGADLHLRVSVKSIRQEAGVWIVNDSLSAPILIGAGGHFCPVAREFATRDIDANESVVLAQETEFLLPQESRDSFPVAGDCPEFFFCPDLAGYGWIVRKGDYVNIGLGREHERHLATHMEAFVAELQRMGKLPCELPQAMHGHAYRLRKGISRVHVPPGVLLIGDALGLADPHSGEGIRPAIESGIIAAGFILKGCTDRSRLTFGEFATRCATRFGADQILSRQRQQVPSALWKLTARWAMRSRWFHRHVLLDRWFLHAHQPAL